MTAPHESRPKAPRTRLPLRTQALTTLKLLAITGGALLLLWVLDRSLAG
jgi:hypothetical protein